MTPAEPEHNGKDGRDMLYETIAFPDNAPLQCSIVEVEEYPFHHLFQPKYFLLYPHEVQ